MLKKHRIDALKIPSSLSSTSAPSLTKVAKAADYIFVSCLQMYLLGTYIVYYMYVCIYMYMYIQCTYRRTNTGSRLLICLERCLVHQRQQDE